MVSLAGGEAIQQTAGLVSKVKIQEPTKSGQPQPMRAIKSVWLWSFGYLLEPYSQLRAGTLGGDYRTPPGVLQSFSQGGGPGDQLDDVRTLEVCFEGVLESYHGESGK